MNNTIITGNGITVDNEKIKVNGKTIYLKDLETNTESTVCINKCYNLTLDEIDERDSSFTKTGFVVGMLVGSSVGSVITTIIFSLI